MRSAVKCSKKKYGRYLFLFLIVILGFFSFAPILQAFERGPFVCNNGCLVQTPLIDAKTRAFLDSQLAPVDMLPLSMYASGTTYIICNPFFCATYRQTFSGDYAGSDRVPIEGGAGGGGGPGGACGPGPGGSEIIGYVPIYGTATVTTPTGSTSQTVITGYAPVYGPPKNDASIGDC